MCQARREASRSSLGILCVRKIPGKDLEPGDWEVTRIFQKLGNNGRPKKRGRSRPFLLAWHYTSNGAVCYLVPGISCCIQQAAFVPWW